MYCIGKERDIRPGTTCVRLRLYCCRACLLFATTGLRNFPLLRDGFFHGLAVGKNDFSRGRAL